MTSSFFCEHKRRNALRAVFRGHIHGAIRSVLTASVLCIAASAAAQPPSSAPEIAVKAGNADTYPAHRVTFANGVKGIPDVVYGVHAGYRPLTLDLYLPPSSVKVHPAGFPLVVYIHGGAWLAGNSRRAVPFVDFPDVLASLAARGYVVASVNYRLSAEARFPAQIQDVTMAIRWLKAHASEYGIDPAHALTWGVSAGGYLAVLAAVACNTTTLARPVPVNPVAPDANAGFVNASDASNCVQGAVSWYGVFDLSTIAGQADRDKAMSREDRGAPEWRLVGCFGDKECAPGRLAAASPVSYVGRGDPPMLLIAGSADTLVPWQQTLEMAEKLKTAGVKYRLVVLPGVNHSLIGKSLQQTRDANLKALAATFLFIDQTIGDSSGARR